MLRVHVYAYIYIYSYNIARARAKASDWHPMTSEDTSSDTTTYRQWVGNLACFVIIRFLTSRSVVDYTKDLISLRGHTFWWQRNLNSGICSTEMVLLIKKQG